ncbi:hypothetical protein RSK20926_08142 [Roseobacter sp. SK209-2-6]|nr:hypothetical protein RSK20926_08142 [Roseobacter sp. SK209-2-6]
MRVQAHCLAIDGHNRAKLQVIGQVILVEMIGQNGFPLFVRGPDRAGRVAEQRSDAVGFRIGAKPRELNSSAWATVLRWQRWRKAAQKNCLEAISIG